MVWRSVKSVSTTQRAPDGNSEVLSRPRQHSAFKALGVTKKGMNTKADTLELTPVFEAHAT
jgi:hypothetical protein